MNKIQKAFLCLFLSLVISSCKTDDHTPINKDTLTDFSEIPEADGEVLPGLPEYAEVWGSGGVRHGLDAAKLFALGATTVGFAKPMLEAAMHTADAVIQTMQTIEYELRVALFCTGSRNLHELREKVRC